ncbi:MAG TPA: TRAP transporter small permease [Nitrospinota bacterium]|nr:TRAP transporter small permease [Nitrospinota bacterium]
MQIFKDIDQFLKRVEETILISFVILMVFLAFFQVVLRNIFSAGIIWADIFLRHLVLWIGLLGAVLVTSERRHIKIDIFSKFFSEKAQPKIYLGMDTLSLFVTILLTKASYTFVVSEKLGGSLLFLNIPTWVMESIIPIAFALISLHFLIRIFEGIYEIVRKESR